MATMCLGWRDRLVTPTHNKENSGHPRTRASYSSMGTLGHPVKQQKSWKGNTSGYLWIHSPKVAAPICWENSLAFPPRWRCRWPEIEGDGSVSLRVPDLSSTKTTNTLWSGQRAEKAPGKHNVPVYFGEQHLLGLRYQPSKFPSECLCHGAQAWTGEPGFWEPGCSSQYCWKQPQPGDNPKGAQMDSGTQTPDDESYRCLHASYI